VAGASSSFGEYQLGEQLSTSASADVFVADANRGAGPTVVLKIFHKVDANELPALAGRAQLIDAMDCSHLVLPTSWGVVDRRVFLARPALPAVDLGHLLKEIKQRQPAVSIEVALTIVVDLLVGLRALHSVRSPSGLIYHGDLCAAHVLIGDDGTTHLLGAESPRRSAGPSQRLDVAGTSALLYEVLNAGSLRRLPAAEQGIQSVLRAQFEPLFLQGLGLADDESQLGAGDLLSALKVQIDLAGIRPQRAQLAEWAQAFGVLRPDPSKIKSAPPPIEAREVPAPLPIDFGAVTSPDVHGHPLEPQMRTEAGIVSPFAPPTTDEKTEVDRAASNEKTDVMTPAATSVPPPSPSPARPQRLPGPTPGMPQTEPDLRAIKPPARAVPPALRSGTPNLPQTEPALRAITPPPSPRATAPRIPTPPPAARVISPPPAPNKVPFEAAPTQPSPSVFDSLLSPAPPTAPPPLPGRPASTVPVASPAFVPADTLPSNATPAGPASRPPPRPSTAFEPDPRKLGEILVAMRATTQTQVDQALEFKSQRGGHLGDLLLQSGAISDQDLATARGRQAGVPTITADKLSALKVPDQLLSALPEVYASAKRVLPVAFDPAQKCVTLLVADPRDASAITEARVLIAAQHADVWAAPRDALEETIRRLYAARGHEVAGDSGDLLLLATPNQTLAGSLKVRLVAEGFAVRHVTDGQVARDALEAGGIRGIVTELALPKVDGYNLILTTRSRDEYRDIPIFVFSNRADDYHMSKALELGADDFLPMPLNVDFLVSKLRRSIVRKPAPAAAAGPAQQGGVSGSLKEMPLPEIVQTLELGRKTATVEISFNDGLTGQIVFVEGQVVSASAPGQDGETAFYALATPRDGTFHIRYGQADGARNINNTTTFLLLEAMRRVDESR